MWVHGEMGNWIQDRINSLPLWLKKKKKSERKKEKGRLFVFDLILLEEEDM